MASRLTLLTDTQKKSKTSKSGSKKLDLKKKDFNFLAWKNIIDEFVMPQKSTCIFTDNPKITPLLELMNSSRLTIYTTEFFPSLSEYDIREVDIDDNLPTISTDLLILIIDSDDFKSFIAPLYRESSPNYDILYFGKNTLERQPTSLKMFSIQLEDYVVMYHRSQKQSSKKSSLVSIVELPEERISEDVILDEFHKNFPFPEIKNIVNGPSKKIGPIDSESWFEEYKQYIQSLIRYMIIKDENIIQGLTNDDNMLIWRLAITHESYNPDPMGNYDQLESVGDEAVGLAFKDYISSVQHDPRIDKAELSISKSRYMSKEYQGNFGKEMKLSQWVITDPTVKASVKINEDLFESFSGALLRTGDSIKGGLGYLLVRNFLESIFKNAKIMRPKATTILTQGYSRHKWGNETTYKPREENLGNGKWSFTYSFGGPMFASYLENEARLNHRPRPTRLSIEITKTGIGKDATRDLAAEETLLYFEKYYHITPEDIRINDLRRNLAYRNNEEFKKLVERAYSKDPNLVRIYVHKLEEKLISTALDESIVMLIGVESGPDKILRKLSILTYNKKIQTDIQHDTALIELYLSS